MDNLEKNFAAEQIKNFMIAIGSVSEIAHMAYENFKNVGFTDDQAMQLTTTIVSQLTGFGK